MRILMTTDTVGGVWTFTEELASGLLARGCAICLTSIGKPPSESQLAWCEHMRSQWQDHFRYERIDAPLEWMTGNHMAYTAAAPSLLRLTGSFRADLIHSSQFCFGALPLDIPKIVTAHSDVFSWAQACRGGALEPSDWLTQYTGLVTRGIAGADSIVAPTHWMAGSLASTFSLPQIPAVIHNGRTIAPVGSSSRKRQAITAGRLWDEAKNISLLARVRAPMPLLVAGDTTYDGSAVAGLGNLTLVGKLSTQDLLTVFRESTLYICTSQYEPFGLAPLEAAFCGCAILAYDIPSMREIWSSAALYFDNAESLSHLLHQLDSDPHLLSETQQRSSARARLFHADSMVEGYHQLFERALTASKDAVYAA